MAKPIVHARSSARRFGGVAEDYLEIHDLMDSSKAVFADNRHRALTHNSWFIFILERIFGHEIELTCTACDGRGWDVRVNGIGEEILGDNACERCDASGKKGTAHVRDVGEQHILEDFGNKFIPTPGDYLEGMELQEWMNNAIKGAPTSHRKLREKDKTMRRRAVTLD